MATSNSAPVSRAERLLAFMAIGIAFVSFVGLIVVLAAPLVGVDPESMTAPGWQTVFMVAYFGLPTAFLLMMTLLVVRFVANRRANRER